MDTLILGAGYAGVNAYYELRKRGLRPNIISANDSFDIKNAWLRKTVTGKDIRYSFTLPRFVRLENVQEIDLASRTVRTDKARYEPDNIIIALGASRKDLEHMIMQMLKVDEVSLGAAYKYDEYLALQIAFYLKALGKKVSYSGSYLSWLGDRVEKSVRKLVSQAGIESARSADYLLPLPTPPHPLSSFLRVNSYLEVKQGVYAAGDAADMGPKLGELAMRMGVYTAKRIAGYDQPFRPMFINIIDTGRGKGIHVRSDYPWQGSFQSVKVSKLRSMMKRFLENYYIHRKGKMGFLVHL
ncbi:MAG: FAD-dependent oxidoreductase [Conexivisphaerales archaeon]